MILVAASCANVGSALISLNVSVNTVAAATKPLNGIFVLSNFAFVTAETSAIFAVVTLASAILLLLQHQLRYQRLENRLKSLRRYSISCDISG
jgi:hypothetical protein